MAVVREVSIALGAGLWTPLQPLPSRDLACTTPARCDLIVSLKMSFPDMLKNAVESQHDSVA